jgi:putative heme-binding domain-containing protein
LALRAQPDGTADAAGGDLASLLTLFAGDESVQTLLAAALVEKEFPQAARRLVLRAIAQARLREYSIALRMALSNTLAHKDRELAPLAVAAVRALPRAARKDLGFVAGLAMIIKDADAPRELRIAALAGSFHPNLNDDHMSLLLEGLAADSPVEVRSAAVEALCAASFQEGQPERLMDAMKSVGPLELNRLLEAFDEMTDTRLALELVETLKSADALLSLRVDRLREALAECGPEVKAAIDELEALVNVDAAAQRARIEELLPQIAGGDVRRGHAVFYSAKAACSACHKLANAGGTSGPELTGLGEARTERDFLESILFPSLSFVRSYEPALIVTVDGLTINGVIREETETEYVVATGPNQETRVVREDVEKIEPSSVSIMPAGLDKQLSVEELADLVAFLKSAKR